MSDFTYIVKDETGFWDQGIKKRKLPWWAEKVPVGFDGFVKISFKTVILYNKDWTVLKTIKRPLTNK